MPANATTTAAIFAAVLVAAAALAWLVVIRRRRDVWRRFARRHRLQVTAPGPVPGLEGTVAGRPFRLAAVEGGSDAEELGIVDVEMSLGLNGPLPDGLQAEDATGVIGEAQRALEDQTVSTGDHDFDHSVVIRCPDPAAAVEYFDAERRRAFRDLVAAHASAEIGLANGRIYLRDREMVSRLDDLESRLALLRRIAPAFDVREPARSGGARC